MKILILLFIFIIIPKIITAQEQTPPYDILNKIVKPATPISPEVTSLGRYAMQPPSYSNGTPQESIPLYEIKENGITYPLQLTYSTKGFRIKEEAEMAGLGWTLSEGMIARIVYDLPDENPTLKKKFEEFDYTNLVEEYGTGIINSDLPPTHPAYNYTANRLYNSLYDGKPDMYIYNFNGYAGRFIWVNNKAFCFPHTDLKIQKSGTNFIISAPDGVDYIFFAADQADVSITDAESNSYTNQVKAFGQGVYVTFMYQPYTTSWRLSRILNKTTKAVINFEYGFYGKIDHTTELDISSFTFWTANIQSSVVSNIRYIGRSIFNSNLSNNYSSRYYLKKITSDHVSVDFITKKRLDFPEAPAIDTIKVSNPYDLKNPIKTIKLTHGYFGNNSNASTEWLKLKKITMNGLGDQNKEYTFEYTDESDFDCGGDKHGCNIDHWGFANGAANTSLVPKTPMVQQMEANGVFNLFPDIPWANREPNFRYSRKYALSKIIYPTKGYTAYNYESAGGRGVRIESQEDYDGEKLQHKYYTYYPDNPVVTPQYTANVINDKAYLYPCMDKNPGNEVHLPVQTLIITGSTKNYLIYEDDNSNFYEKVTEFIGTRDGKGGKNEYNFIREIPSYKPLLTEEANYQYNNSNPIKRTIYTYTIQSLKGIQYWGDPVMFEKGVEEGCNGLTLFPPSDEMSGYGYYLSNIVLSGIGQLNVNWIKTDQTTISENRNGNMISQITKTYFNTVDPSTGFPKNTMPVKTEDYSSDGTSNTIEYYYAGDNDPDNQGSILGIPQMWDINNVNYKYLVSPAIKTKSFKGTKLIAKDFKEFTYNSVNDLILLTGYENYPTGTNEKLRYTLSYDSYANLLSYNEINNLPISYVYGYKNSVPIAKIVNVDYGTVETILGAETLKNFCTRPIPTDAEVKNFLAPLFSSAQLKHAIVNTYTYKPLVGLTSITNENNVTTYYNYDDAYGNLQNIQNDQSNILKSYEYQYKSNSYPNPTVYINTTQSQVFTKNGCPNGKIGAQVTYSVDAGMYKSTLSQGDADWLALQDISKNGQNYADKYGSCIYPVGMKGIIVRSGNALTGRITRIKVYSTSNTLLYDFDTSVPDYYAAVPSGTYNFLVSVEDAGLDSFNSITLNNGSTSICKINTQGNDIAEFSFWPVIVSDGVDIVLNADYCP